MPMDGRYIAKSHGWRCDECPGMDGISQGAMDGDEMNVQGWTVYLKEPGMAMR